jgi:hypothetical protein
VLGELEAFCRQRRSLFYAKADLPVPDGVLRGLGGRDPSPYLAAAAALCRRVFGEAPRTVRPLEEAGTFHVLCRAELSDGRAAVVRLGALSDLGPDFLLHLDSWAFGRLRAAGLPALTVHAVDLSRSCCPYDAQVLEEARGTPLKAYDGDEERLRPLLFALGGFVARLHGIRTAGFGPFDVGPLVLGEGGARLAGACPSWAEYVLCRLEDHVARCVALGAIDGGEARRVVAAFRAADDLLAGVVPCLLHGDLGSHNVFTAGGAVTAVIDWEDCLSGDPAFEVASWATFHPDHRHQAFLDGYRRERPLGPEFGRRFWLYYLRVALCKTVLRHRLGLTDRPGRPPASLRVRKALERLEGAGRARPAA